MMRGRAGGPANRRPFPALAEGPVNIRHVSTLAEVWNASGPSTEWPPGAPEPRPRPGEHDERRAPADPSHGSEEPGPQGERPARDDDAERE